MKKIMNFVCSVLLVAGLCGCEKINLEKLEGSWSEKYDPEFFAMDGSVSYIFDGNLGYRLHVYDALAGESWEFTGSYSTDHNTITLNPDYDWAGSITYQIVKLTPTEMEWQREGTIYSKGTWGSDFRHFVRM